jgi:hypothetical protein
MGRNYHSDSSDIKGLGLELEARGCDDILYILKVKAKECEWRDHW